MRHPLPIAAAAGLACAITGASAAQVVINEVIQDPPGSDTEWELIELFGRPGMSLDGYAIGLFKGGADPDGNDVADTPTEIDEAFSLDGLSLGPNGFLVLYNNRLTDETESSFLIDPQATVAGFADTHVPAPDVQGELSNGDSSTYLLIRARANYRFENGMSIYEPGYAMRKEGVPDADFDGKLDFGFETPNAEQHDPMQIVDDVAWSNNGGKEFVRSSEQEISDTPNFDPDAISRVNYFGANPMLGNRVNGSGEVVNTRMADESWIYGEIIRLPVSLDTRPEYGNRVVGSFVIPPKAPTDPNGPTYDCPPNPAGESDCSQSPTGALLFDDLIITQGSGASEIGFNITPGTFNDDPRFGITQFRFVTADFDFDGDADADDLALIQARLGSTLDDRTDCRDEFGDLIINPDTGTPFQCYAFEGRAFNALEAMRNMDPTDGKNGANAPEVTASDVAVVAAMFPADRLCADQNEDGALTGADFNAFLTNFSAGDLKADVNQDNSLTGADFNGWLTAFSAGLNGPTCNP